MVDATRQSAHRNRETQNGTPCGDLREGNRDFKGPVWPAAGVADEGECTVL